MRAPWCEHGRGSRRRAAVSKGPAVRSRPRAPGEPHAQQPRRSARRPPCAHVPRRLVARAPTDRRARSSVVCQIRGRGRRIWAQRTVLEGLRRPSMMRRNSNLERGRGGRWSGPPPPLAGEHRWWPGSRCGRGSGNGGFVGPELPVQTTRGRGIRLLHRCRI